MIKRKLVTGASLSPGTVVHLTFEQFDARRHLLTAVKEQHQHRSDKRRLAYKSEHGLFFKAGEELGVEGTVDRQLQTAFAASDEDLVAASAAKPGVVSTVTSAQKGQLTRARNKLADAEADAAEAQRAFDDAAENKKAAAQKKLEAAKAALDDARSALAALAERYGVSL